MDFRTESPLSSSYRVNGTSSRSSFSTNFFGVFFGVFFFFGARFFDDSFVFVVRPLKVVW